MRLSEAIRLAQFEPQCQYSLRNADGASCAMGGALKSVGRLDDFLRLGAATDHTPTHRQIQILGELGWQALLMSDAACPLKDCGYLKGKTLYYMITHLNDGHSWSREQIADQVEIWEMEFESQQLTAPPVEVAV